MWPSRGGSERSVLGCAHQSEEQAEVMKGWKELEWRGDCKGSWESLRRKAHGYVLLRFPNTSLALGHPALPVACLLSISHGHAHLQSAAPYVQGRERSLATKKQGVCQIPEKVLVELMSPFSVGTPNSGPGGLAMGQQSDPGHSAHHPTWSQTPVTQNFLSSKESCSGFLPPGQLLPRFFF